MCLASSRGFEGGERVTSHEVKSVEKTFEWIPGFIAKLQAFYSNQTALTFARFVDTISSTTATKATTTIATLFCHYLLSQKIADHHGVSIIAARLTPGLSFQVQNFSPNWKRMVAMIGWWVIWKGMNRERQ